MGAGPRLRRRSTARLEQSAGRDLSQSISGCLQTFTQNSLLYSVFLLTLFLITFSPCADDIAKCPWSCFFYLRHFNIDYFTLHYITYSGLVCYSDGASRRQHGWWYHMVPLQRSCLQHSLLMLTELDCTTALDLGTQKLLAPMVFGRYVVPLQKPIGYLKATLASSITKK